MRVHSGFVRLPTRGRKRAPARCRICTWRGPLLHVKGHLQRSRLTGFGLAPPVQKQSIMKNDQGPFHFSSEMLREHRRHKRSSWKHLRSTRLLVILSSPLIYACVIPFLMVDASVELYQLVCFPIYGIPIVRRKDYVVFDRGRLAYLNTIEKIGCIYCSYANGLLAMITEIAARSEQHFCPIKHAHRLAQTHSRYGTFLPYGDARAYRENSDAVAQAFDDLSKRAK